jgi:AraC-like DNA-binding protein
MLRALQQQEIQLRVEKIREFIQEHYQETLPKIIELAALWHTNECSLKKQFKQHYNCSIYQYYINVRLTKAHQLILQKKYTLQQIANACGYNNYTTFYLAYKKHFGQTPKKHLIP